MRQWILTHADIHLRHGGKRHRKRQVIRLISALEEISEAEPGVRRPEQIGRGQIHRFYQRYSHFAPSTQRDYYYSFVLLWQFLKRPGTPPKP